MREIRYGGFWIRAAASLLDLLMLGVLNGALAAGHFGAYIGRSQIDAATGAVSGGYDATSVVLVLLLPMVIVVGFWASRGATPGQSLCGLRIVDATTGARPAAWRCFVRYVMAGVSAVCAGFGFLWIAIDPRKQAWHDKAASTIVVRTR